MSFQITCPNCGVLARVGVSLRRPRDDASSGEPDERAWGACPSTSPTSAASSTRRVHRSACKTWFTAKRDTRTNTVRSTEMYQAEA